MSKFDWFLLCLVIVVASVMVLVVCLQLPQTESQKKTTSLKYEKVPVRRISPLPKEQKIERGVVEKPMAGMSQVFVEADLNEALCQARIKLAEARQRSSLQPASLSSEFNPMKEGQIRTR